MLTSAASKLSGNLGCSGLEALWEAAGGSHAEAFMAAEIAMAESGGRQYALSPTNDYGYWQINGSHGPAEATFNPIGNAKAAIAISGDGTNWSPWTTYVTGRLQRALLTPVPEPAALMAPMFDGMDHRTCSRGGTGISRPWTRPRCRTRSACCASPRWTS